MTARSLARVMTGSLAVAALLTAAAAATADPVEDIEARVRQIYFEGYPITGSGPLDAAQIARLGELLIDESEQPYWANIILALGAGDNPNAYPLLADFASRPPSGEVAPGVYQAWVSLPVALGMLAREYSPAFVLLESMARDAGNDPGWRFQSLQGAALGAAIRRSAITGVAVSGRPEAAIVLDDLQAHARPRGAPAAAASGAPDELSQHLEFARELHARSATQGAASVLRREPVSRDD